MFGVISLASIELPPRKGFLRHQTTPVEAKLFPGLLVNQRATRLVVNVPLQFVFAARSATDNIVTLQDRSGRVSDVADIFLKSATSASTRSEFYFDILRTTRFPWR